MIGRVISHYKIIEKLDEGGMGIVYKAYDTTLNRTVALKFLHHYITANSSEKERFYHEARAAAALINQNVAVIYEIGEYEGEIFLVMEHVEGKTLKFIIEHESESLTIKKVLNIAVQICEGLEAAHEKGIVHRDIKSDNIMLTPKGQVKIMDFGLAKVKSATRITQEGSTVGTAAYMSPEQAQGEDVDYRSDIFSFGVVLYEMLTTHLPFNGEHQAAILYSLVNEEPQPIARFNEKISPDLEHIVSKALSKDREERYQHIDDMLADLRRERKNLEYAQSGYIKASTLSKNTSINKIQKNKKALSFIISTIVIVLLTVVFIFFNPFKSHLNNGQVTNVTEKSLAVMYFENIPDSEDKDHVGEMLSNLLITSLSQVKGLEVISRERLLDIQKDIVQNDTKSLSPALANRVAKRAGVTEMLIGSILQEKPRLAVTTRLIDVNSGKILSSQQVTNFESNNIFRLVDSLSYLLRGDLRFNSTTPLEVKSVMEVTTKSTDAYRAYVQGLDLIFKYYFNEANAAFAKAVELDSSFAMAHYYLSLTQRMRGEINASLKSLNEAVKLEDKVTERERLQILAVNYGFQNNPVKATEMFEQVINQYPHEIQAYPILGELYRSELLEPEKAVEIGRKGLKIEPSQKTLWNMLAYSLASLNKKQAAIDAVNKYITLAPAEPNSYDSKGDIYAWFTEYDSSRAAYLKAIDLRRDFSSADKLGYYAVLNQQYKDAEKYFEMSGFQLPVIDIHRGQFNSAQKKLKIVLTSKISQGRRLRAFNELIHLYYEMDQYPEMLLTAKEFSSKLSEIPVTKNFNRLYLGWSFAANMKISEAETQLDDLLKDITLNNSPYTQAIAKYFSAIISFQEGKYELALEKFKKVYSLLPPNHEPNIFFAITLLKSGHIPEAITELQRLKYWAGNQETYILLNVPGNFGDWPIPQVKAHYWLGVAYERQGKKDNAIKEFNRFLDIWKDADFKSAEIIDAKARVAKLKNLALIPSQ